MLDAHFHLDRFPHPLLIANEAANRGVFTIAVTNLPSHFRQGLPHVRNLPHVRLALGLHPLAAQEDLSSQRMQFLRLLDSTSFVGEVGLDFSREGIKTRETQVATFRFIAESVAGRKKVISLHSRGAESEVLTTLAEFNIQSVIFHWYSGPLGVLEEAISHGHFFSINPAMIRSASGKRIIERIPPDRILTETDGPYVRVGRSPAHPWDVAVVEAYLGSLWSIGPEDVRKQVSSSFRQMLSCKGIALSAW